ncbi:Glycosylphosphatidylinositol anchor synthesis protein [Ceraceosorus bombacis]|uniref:GPI ethanolamine phosphate transferase 1 n=1 Tax=Ceraceosorus bombacis TaxID=401625 RepID=A0A0P1BHK7_9BASI|nr:Glycosylphosphatidylinositol anchor synthesis protein [Ceraceosorus bombacis]
MPAKSSSKAAAATADAQSPSVSQRTRSARPSSSLNFLLLSLIFHLIYSASIFDVYFTSPVIHPDRRYSLADTYIDDQGASLEPLHAAQLARQETANHTAKRLVLIVGDGLRADTAFARQSLNLAPLWNRRDALDLEREKISQEEAARSYGLELRHESAQEAEGFYAAPYLRKMALEKGSFGVSHTRVPTESRPGHVALIAGMYEDVSAVTKGWAQNPMPFDSLFNASARTYSFGSPDILPMFAKGAVPGRVLTESYDESDEDFTRDATHLDIWVLDRLKALLDRARTDSTLDMELRQSGVVFFLHLLGPDTTGHTYRPQSREYVGNAAVVDAVTKAAEQLLSDFFNDDRQTAFIFTADHGMSRKGNHGDGEPDNTRTPLIAWGKGINRPRPLSVEHGEHRQQLEWRHEQRIKDAYYQKWGAMDQMWRQDVEQADITPLMASLLGLPMPANSEGRLPLSYLNFSPEHAARAALANAQGVLEMYKVKHSQRAARMLNYMPFHKLLPEADLSPGTKRVDQIKLQIRAGRYEQAIEDSARLLDDALEGARYLQTYDWLILCAIITAGYLGSIAHGLAFLLRTYVFRNDQLQRTRGGRGGVGFWVALPVLIALWSKFALERSPPTYFLYAIFPALFWGRALDDRHLFLAALRALHVRYAASSHPTLSLLRGTLGRASLAIIALAVMALGYLVRPVWSVGFLLIGFFWPALAIDTNTRARHEGLLSLWPLLCTLCALFTLGGLDKEESVPFLVSSGALFLLLGLAALGLKQLYGDGAPQSTCEDNSGPKVGSCANVPNTGDRHEARFSRVMRVQLIVLVVATAVTASSSYSLQRKQGLPLPNEIIAWLVLIFSITFPLTYGFRSSSGTTATEAQSRGQSDRGRQPAAHRLLIIVFAFAPVFILLSIRDEALFFAIYVATLLVWARIEGALQEERFLLQRYKDDLAAADQATTSQSSTSHTRCSIATDEPRALALEDLRIVITFIFFLHVGFFGTGNIASISSFYLSPVYRLVPIFSPFLMAALLLLKILVPFVLLAAIFHVLCVTPRSAVLAQEPISTRGKLVEPSTILGPRSPGGLSLADPYALVLAASCAFEVLAITFLFAVRTEGSWLEIGRSITHFVMANLLQVFVLALAGLAGVVVGGQTSDGTSNSSKS